LVLAIISTAIYRLLLHPLASIPGPKLAAITRLWLAFYARRGKNNIFLPALHKQYGPIVRISPNEVLICSEEAVRACYHAGSTFTKGEWYQVCSAPDSRRKGDDRFDLLTEKDKERYRLQRRAIGPAYSIKGMEKHEALLDGYLDHFCSKLASMKGSWIDLAEWMHIFAIDGISTFTFSKRLDYTSLGHDGGNMEGSDKHWAFFTVVGLFPWITDLMQSIPKVGMLLMVPVAFVFGLPTPTGMPMFAFAVPNVLSRLQRLESTAEAKMPADRPGLVTSNHGLADNGKPVSEHVAEGEEQDLLASVMQLHASKEERFLPAWVLGISLTNFGAGHDTMTMTLSSAVYWLATSREAKAKLMRELEKAEIGPGSTYAEIVNRVPYLMGCLKESLRLFPVIGTSMPRVVPETGVTLSGKYLPPGTIVGCHQWALGHDATLFPDPESFKPERWLPDGTEEKKRAIGRMDGVWLGFGGGSRSCPGQHLARFFVIKLLARLFGEFEVEVRGKPDFHGWFSTHLYGIEVSLKQR
ncbi:cytochrome P450, partial [Polyplosphaeria fusca]